MNFPYSLFRLFSYHSIYCFGFSVFLFFAFIWRLMNLCGGDTIVDSDLVDLVSDPVSFRFFLIC